MTSARFEVLIHSSWALLHSYYRCTEAHNPVDFLVLTSNDHSRVLVDDASDPETTFIAIEFPKSLKLEIDDKDFLSLQDLSLVCEELSHFFHLTQAAAQNELISPFELETRAEVDRFLSFLHWNDFYPSLRFRDQFENCRQVCEVLFEHRNFNTSNEALYLSAESRAFHHIKRAFYHCWTKRWVDTSRFDPHAQNYFLEMFTRNRSFLRSMQTYLAS